ncbi:uncharacterized protein LOC144073343 [Stigmatopora argus]
MIPVSFPERLQQIDQSVSQCQTPSSPDHLLPYNRRRGPEVERVSPPEWTPTTAMASTPSASALTSVLRCRGTVWTRNPPGKRNPTSARGQILLSAFGLAVRYDSPPQASSGPRRLREPPEGDPEADARAAGSRGLDGTTGRPAGGADGGVATRLFRPCQINVFIRDACESPGGATGGAPGVACECGEVTPSFVEARRATVRSTCRSLQLLLTHIVRRRMALPCACARGRHRKIKTEDSGHEFRRNGPD